MMTAYQFGLQWKRDRWTKIDYSAVPLTGIKNIDEYGAVSSPLAKFHVLSLTIRSRKDTAVASRTVDADSIEKVEFS